jgi:hypothetical protein
MLGGSRSWKAKKAFLLFCFGRGGCWFLGVSFDFPRQSTKAKRSAAAENDGQASRIFLSGDHIHIVMIELTPPRVPETDVYLSFEDILAGALGEHEAAAAKAWLDAGAHIAPLPTDWAVTDESPAVHDTRILEKATRKRKQQEPAMQPVLALSVDKRRSAAAGKEQGQLIYRGLALSLQHQTFHPSVRCPAQTILH